MYYASQLSVSVRLQLCVSVRACVCFLLCLALYYTCVFVWMPLECVSGGGNRSLRVAVEMRMHLQNICSPIQPHTKSSERSPARACESGSVDTRASSASCSVGVQFHSAYVNIHTQPTCYHHTSALTAMFLIRGPPTPPPPISNYIQLSGNKTSSG